MKNAYLFLITLMLCSCAATNFSKQEELTMNSWIGHSKAELIQTWGPPKSVSSDGKGGEIYTYEKSVSFGQTPGKVYSNSNNIYYTNPQSNVITRSRMFYMDNTGKIYHWLSQGRQGY